MKSALGWIGGFTLFLGLTNFATASLQERVTTCETRVNSSLLQIINLYQQSASNETKIAQQVLSKQIERATGMPGPGSASFESLFRSSNALTGKMARGTEEMAKLLSEGCEEQRQIWILFSMLTVLVNAAIACAAFWLGLRVVDHARDEDSSARDEIAP